MTYPDSVEGAYDEIDRLRRLERALKAWAAAHRGHYRRFSLYEPEPGGYVPRAEYLAIEAALLAEVGE
jgi:hypothetical protein